MLLQVQHLSSTSFSNAEERVQQLLHLQLAQRQEVAALSSALQAANIRVQTLETQLRTAQAAPHPPAVSLTHLTFLILRAECVFHVAFVGCKRPGFAAAAR